MLSRDPRPSAAWPDLSACALAEPLSSTVGNDPEGRKAGGLFAPDLGHQVEECVSNLLGVAPGGYGLKAPYVGRRYA